MSCYTPTPRLRLWFTRPTFQTAAAAVTRLRIADDSADLLSLVCPDTDEPASTGNLELALRLAFILAHTPVDYGSLAVKSFDAAANKLQTGPVLSGIRAGTGVVVTGGTAGGAGTPLAGYRYGSVTVTAVPLGEGSAFQIDTIRLSGATEEAYEQTLGIGLLAGRTAYFRGRCRIPAMTGIGSVSLAWRGWILGKQAGDLPPLGFTYRILPAPSDTPVDLPTEDTDGELNMDDVSVARDQYVLVESGPIVATPGGQLLFSVSRDASAGDGYAGDLHVLHQELVLLEATEAT